MGRAEPLPVNLRVSRFTGLSAVAVPKRRGRPDLRRVRSQTTYTAQEAADILGVAVGTVRRWLRDGLPALDERRPVLVFGKDLKTWLGKRSTARKRKCRPDEMYCLRCRAPRKPCAGTVQILLRNRKTLLIKGRCNQCNAEMNRGGAVASINQIAKTFDALTIHQEHLAGCDTPLLNRYLEKDPIE